MALVLAGVGSFIGVLSGTSPWRTAGRMVGLAAIAAGVTWGIGHADLDDASTVIWIADAKTPAGRRRLRVSGMVSDLLAVRAEGRKPTDRLLSVTRRETLRKWVRRICVAAGVPMVTTHGLRGLCGSLNTELVADVARMLGHSSSRVTLMHYVDPSALQAGRTMTMDDLLAEELRKSVDGGPAATDPPSRKVPN